MEKRRPHYPLPLVQQLAANMARIRFTRVAVEGAAELGLDTAGMREVLLALRPLDFFKSMNAYADATIWQDVYRPMRNGVPLYVKLTVYAAENLLVVSFKRR